MPKNNEALGSGLAAIFGPDVQSVLDEIENNAKSDQAGRKVQLSVDEIVPNPYQPRKDFDQVALKELADSISQHGVFTPVLVRQSSAGTYQLVTGERRLKASKMAGKKDIPAIIVDFTDDQMMEVSLLENIQRENLNAIEEAQAYQQLITRMNYTQQQLAERIGKSREHVANTLRLLQLPEEVRKLVEDGKLSMGHVRPLITLDQERCVALAKKAVKEGLSVRNVETLANKKPAMPKPPVTVDPFVRDLENRLQEKYGTRVRIDSHSINISYSDNEDLNRILEEMGMIE